MMLVEKIRKCFETSGIDEYTAEVLGEVAALQRRADELEEVLIMLVRTAGRLEDSGAESEHDPVRDSFAAAMREARMLLGLEHRSVLTRTEPRT